MFRTELRLKLKSDVNQYFVSSNFVNASKVSYSVGSGFELAAIR